ncbi:MAG TPA: flavin reductase family protein [Candidatus Nitrosotalea sp.]|nr:flavin reductase family protein [Nitrososphaerota archaeon]HKU32601.1 flavin reductase family protein [Candidatus Nitrosotalea sp.]
MESKNVIAQRFFVTGVSLVTSHGPNGKNVMAAEWTMQISYNPLLIAVFIHKGSNTLDNIKHTKKFGINVASEKQSALVSVAGGYSRKEIDKLNILNLFDVIESKKTGLPMIRGCVINAECKLTTIKKIGDHYMVVGRVISIIYDETKKPLIYHRNRYFQIGPTIAPVRREVTVSKGIFDEFCLQRGNKFILKCVGVLVRSKDKILIFNDGHKSSKTIPYVCPQKNTDNKKELENHLKNVKIKIVLKENPQIKKLIIKHKKKNQRVNFVLFRGILKKRSGPLAWKSFKNDLFLKSLVR